MWGIGWSFISFVKDAPTRASELRGTSRKIYGLTDAPKPAIELPSIPAISTAFADAPTSANELPSIPTRSTARGCANARRIARYAILRLNAAARMNSAVATSTIAGPDGRFR